MNFVKKQYYRWKEIEQPLKGLIAGTIVLVVIMLILMAAVIGKKAQTSELLPQSAMNEQLENELSEQEKKEITNLILNVLKENQITNESDMWDKVSKLKEELQEKLKDATYLTEEEKNEIINNLEKLIRNEYQSNVNEANGKLDEVSEIFKQIRESLSLKADAEAVNAIEEKTLSLIVVDENLKKTDLDLYNRLIALNNRLSELNQNLDGSSKETNNRIDKTISEFNKILEAIKKDTTKDYSDKINEIHLKIEEYITELNSQIAELNREIAESNKKVQNSIEDLRTNTDSALKEINKNTNETVSEVKQQTNTELNTQKSMFTDLISSVEEKLTALIAQNRTNIVSLGDSVLINQESIGKINTIATDNIQRTNALEKSVSEQGSNISDLKTTLDECFQSVSNGKRLLASTLTDKGINTSMDASFGEINNNILSLYTSAFAAGVDSVSGISADVEYEYHYHTGSAEEGGGCYSLENRHHHIGNSVNGGGCYTTPNYNISYIYPSCSGGWIKDTNSWGDKDGNRDRRYRGWCSVCGYYCASYSEWSNYPNEAGPTHTSLKATEIKTLTGYSLGCNHTENELLGYETSCGYIDGQIISAKINMSNTKTKSADILTSLLGLNNLTIEPAEENQIEKSTVEESLNMSDEEGESQTTVSENEIEQEPESEQEPTTDMEDEIKVSQDNAENELIQEIDKSVATE